MRTGKKSYFLHQRKPADIHTFCCLPSEARIADFRNSRSRGTLCFVLRTNQSFPSESAETQSSPHPTPASTSHARVYRYRINRKPAYAHSDRQSNPIPQWPSGPPAARPTTHNSGEGGRSDAIQSTASRQRRPPQLRHERPVDRHQHKTPAARCHGGRTDSDGKTARGTQNVSRPSRSGTGVTLPHGNRSVEQLAYGDTIPTPAPGSIAE